MLNKLKKCKRPLACILVIIMMASFIVPYATNLLKIKADGEAITVKGSNRWTYSGHTRYVWRGQQDGLLYFCSEPGQRNSNPGIKKTYYLSQPYANNPYLHCQIAAAGFALKMNQVTYQQAQIYLWNALAGATSGNTIIDGYVAQMLSGQSEGGGSASGSFTLPEHFASDPIIANNNPIQIKLVGGKEYKVEIPLTDIQKEVFSDPGTMINFTGGETFTWTKTFEGNKMVISIEGSTPPQIISPLKIEPSPEMKNKYQLASNIPMVYHIGQVGQDFVGGDWIIQPAVYYLRLVTDPVPVEVQDSESTVKLHEEVFEATYTVDLTKYDFETGKTLEGSEWNVLEAFDENQDGIGDGHFGTVSLELMSPQESAWDGYHTCIENMKTNADGYLKHTDIRTYHYAKTYCEGHPEPEETGDEEADEEAMEEWQAQVEACEASTSFHSIEPGEAYDAMIADRDETYDNFINLEYQYTLQEAKARDGYSRHDVHADDVKIPVVTIASSESGKDQEWAGLYSNKIISTGVYSPKYKDFTVDGSGDGSGGGNDDDDEFIDATEMSVMDAVVLAISDSGKTIKVDADGETMTFDLSKAEIEYDGISKIEVGCYVDVTYDAKSSSSKYKAIVVAAYGGLEPEYDYVTGFVKAVNGKKITIEPESPGHPDVYDITEAKKNGEIWNDYNSSTKIKAGDYIQDMKYIVKQSGAQTASYICFIPKRYLSDAGIISLSLKSTAFIIDQTLAAVRVELDGEEGLTEDKVDEIRTTLETKGLETSIEKENTKKKESLKTATPSNAEIVEESQYDAADNTEDFVFEDDGSLETGHEEQNEEELDVATPSEAIKIVYTIDDDALIGNEDETSSFKPGHSIHLFNGTREGGGVTENPDADITQFSGKENNSPATAPDGNNRILMSWYVYDHRFEGEIHFNKLDLNLSGNQTDTYSSYADSNGDGTLEGAVYGLFAAEDIVHPDGKTGVVFKANELVSIATTDRNGNGSFMAITEEPGTTVNEKGNIVKPVQSTTNLFNMTGYRDDYKDDDDPGRKYSDNVTYNTNAWIGRPLICGEHKYYIKELARSEGYELSIAGKDMPFTNKNSEEAIDPSLSGNAKLYAPYYNNQQGDGKPDPASVEFSVDSKDTKNGYQFNTKNYPEGTKFYFITHGYTEKEIKVEDGTEEVAVVDKNGNPVYKVHEAGEVKYDNDGNPIYLVQTTTDTEVRDENGNLAMISGMSLEDSAKYLLKENGTIKNNPASGATSVPKIRSKTYLSGSSASAEIDATKPLGDLVTVRKAVMDILTGTDGFGYNWADSDAAFVTINLSGSKNEDFVKQIVDWYVANPMWNSAYVEDIYNDNGQYKAILLYDYASIVNGTTQYNTWIYEERTGNLYYSKKYPVVTSSGINRGEYRTYVKFTPDEIEAVYGASGKIRAFTIKHMKQIPDGTTLTLGEDYSKRIAYEYFKLMDTYVGGEPVLDKNGNKIQETEIIKKYKTEIVQIDTPAYTEIPATWNAETQSYTFNVTEEDIQNYGQTSENIEGYTTVDFKATAPTKKIEIDGKQMSYAEYLENYGAMNMSINKSAEQIEAEKASYIEYVQIPNTKQEDVKLNADTETNPIKVMERPIRQQIKVFKDIQTNPDGSYAHDTYSAVHKENLSADGYNRWYTRVTDWLTSLINGESGEESTNKVDKFRFKAYLKSNLERLYRDNDGNIVWLDRNGNVLTPNYVDTNKDGNYDTFNWTRTAQDGSGDSIIDFSEKQLVKDDSLQSSNVQKIYTKVEHDTNSTTTGDNSNNIWANYNNPQTGETKNVGKFIGFTTSQDGANGEAIRANASLYSYNGNNMNVKKTDRINEGQNTGYTRLLEITIDEDGNQVYDYKKFFDAISAANTDKWDDDMHSSDKNYPGQNWFETFYEKYQRDDADTDHTIENTDGTDKDNTAGGDHDTSYKPFQWIRETIFKENGEEKDYYNGAANNVNIENTINTSTFAHENAEASDVVRQFAIDYYLQDEVAKLVQNNGQDEDEAITTPTYAEEVYDIALRNALIKAVNYLKPFYDNDLDTIYAVEWDTEVNGGADNDYTTLNIAETDADKGYYYGISSYLPYGTYVVVEQQPQRIDGTINDFTNKNYKTDNPKEVTLPALYKDDSSNVTFDNYDDNYYYSKEKTPEDLMADYNIRFNEEWADNHMDDLRNYVIRAHNFDGDYEIYKYGLDVDKLKSEIAYNGTKYSYDGFSITQDDYEPLKDYYNSIHKINEKNVTTAEGANDNSHYYADDKNGSITASNDTKYAANAIEERYHYGSISEHSGDAEGLHTMTGIQTAYEGKYASMLVPWTVMTSVNLDSYNAEDFEGFADIKFRNTFYTLKLRIEKLDSETGENILHDGAVFGLYAASRYTTQAEVDEAIANGAPEKTKIGNVKYYLKDTTITGTYEFLKAIGADDIRPYTKIFGAETNQYSGIVPAGTPVCVESEQIVLYDEIGAKTGDMTVYTTTNDINMVAEEDEPKSYHDQNTGYFITPQPIGAGVYVLAELKPPIGYSRTKPIAIEVYSDAVTYYMNGSMDSQVKATIYTDNLINQDE